MPRSEPKACLARPSRSKRRLKKPTHRRAPSPATRSARPGSASAGMCASSASRPTIGPAAAWATGALLSHSTTPTRVSRSMDAATTAIASSSAGEPRHPWRSNVVWKMASCRSCTTRITSTRAPRARSATSSRRGCRRCRASPWSSSRRPCRRGSSSVGSICRPATFTNVRPSSAVLRPIPAPDRPHHIKSWIVVPRDRSPFPPSGSSGGVDLYPERYPPGSRGGVASISIGSSRR